MSTGSEWTEDARTSVREVLADRSLKGEARVTALLDALGMLDIYDVYPRRTHAAVEQVEAYGLVIGVDANGYASEVSFPHGADT